MYHGSVLQRQLNHVVPDDAVEVLSGDGKLGMENGEDWNWTAVLDGDDDGSELERGRCTKRPSGPRAGVASLASADSAGVSSWAFTVVVGEEPGNLSRNVVTKRTYHCVSLTTFTSRSG